MSSNVTTFDGTSIDPEFCTLQTCPLSDAQIFYVPSLGGNVFFCALFGFLALVQLLLGVRYRTWGFMIGMVLGLAGEVVGYVGRVQMHDNPFKDDPFLMYIVALTIAPAFLTASIYLCLARLVVVFGEDLSRFKPRTYTYVFIACDFLALLLQAIGGGIASAANDHDTSQMGVHIMVAGLSWQVFSLFVFIVLAGDFACKVWKSGRLVTGTFCPVVSSKLFKGFLIALVVATITIFTRCIFRAAELSGGFDGPLANDEISFMILEGTMISIATISLSIFHPGLAFKGMWESAGWSFKQPKKSFDTDATYDLETRPRKNPYINLFHRKSAGSDTPMMEEGKPQVQV